MKSFNDKSIERSLKRYSFKNDSPQKMFVTSRIHDSNFLA